MARVAVKRLEQSQAAKQHPGKPALHENSHQNPHSQAALLSRPTLKEHQATTTQQIVQSAHCFINDGSDHDCVIRQRTCAESCGDQCGNQRDDHPDGFCVWILRRTNRQLELHFEPVFRRSEDRLLTWQPIDLIRSSPRRIPAGRFAFRGTPFPVVSPPPHASLLFTFSSA